MARSPENSGEPIKWVPSNEYTHEDLLKQLLETTNQPVRPAQKPRMPSQPHMQQRAPQQQRPQTRSQQQPRPTSVPQLPVEPEYIPLADTKPNKKRRIRDLPLPVKIVAGLAIIGAAGGATYGTNFEGTQNVVGGMFNHADEADLNSITTTQPNKLGLRSLALDKCTDPKAAYIIMKVSARFPLIPVVPTADSKEPVKVQPYMTQETMETLDSTNQSKFSNFMTKDGDGYQYFTVKDLPLALEICDPSDAVQQDGNKVTIDHTKIRMRVEDPLTIKDPTATAPFKINPVYQTTSANMTMDESKGEYISLPDSLFPTIVDPKTDKLDTTFAKNIADLSSSMKSHDQLQAMLTTTETQIVEQLNSAVSGQNGITFPYGKTTLQDAADAAIVERVIGNAKVTPHINGSDAKITMDAPVNASKQAFSSKDLKGFEKDAPVVITNIDIKAGGIQLPKQTAAATPTPTPTGK